MSVHRAGHLTLYSRITMKTLIATILFSLFAVTAASSGAVTLPLSSAPVDATAASTAPESIPTVFDPVCTPPYVACTADCGDLSGNAKGACLRECRHELEECLAH